MKPVAHALISSVLSICCTGYSQLPIQDGPHPAGKIKIALAGDSTQTETAGYGLGFCCLPRAIHATTI